MLTHRAASAAHAQTRAPAQRRESKLSSNGERIVRARGRGRRAVHQTSRTHTTPASPSARARQSGDLGAARSRRAAESKTAHAAQRCSIYKGAPSAPASTDDLGHMADVA